MGFYDRPYMRDGRGEGGGLRGSFSGGIMYGLPKPTGVVKTLLLINIAVILIQAVLGDLGPAGTGRVRALFGVTGEAWWQLWRYITFQFLHAGPGHIFWNMLLLYFLGMLLERRMGERRFLWFYLSSGAVAGVLYAIMVSVVPSSPDVALTSIPLIGASGGVYAVLLACAVWFPDVRILFIIPIRIFVALAFGAMVLLLLSSLSTDYYAGAFWSDVAHFGGLLGAALWIWVLPRASGAGTQVRVKMNQGAWDRKMQKKDEEEKSIDEILRKIHDDGINSLSRKEKKTLAEATKRQRQHGE